MLVSFIWHVLIFALLAVSNGQKVTSNTTKGYDPSVLVDVLSPDQQLTLHHMANTTISLMNSKSVTHFVCFGTLLGLVRHGRRIPWDDDIEFVIPRQQAAQLVRNLERVESSPWCPDASLCEHKDSASGEDILSENCCVWRIRDKVLLTWKPTGIPFKVSTENEYPILELIYYDVSRTSIVVPASQLEFTHFSSFAAPISDVFPLRKATFEDHDVFVPANPNSLLSLMWRGWWDRCVVAYNHRVYCSQQKAHKGLGSGCESPDANAFPKRIFQCDRLPSKYLNPDIYNYQAYSHLTPSVKAQLIVSKQIMVEILRETDRVCKKHNIPYFLHAGGLLGAVRHKGWIPWDYDLDIGMMQEDYERFKTVRHELSKELWVQDTAIDKHYKSGIAKIRHLNSCYVEYSRKHKQWHNGLQVDIFVFKYDSDKTHITCSIIPFKKKLPTDEFFPVSSVEFDGYTFSAPRNVDYFLEARYGRKWKVPDHDKTNWVVKGGAIDAYNTCDFHYAMYPELYPTDELIGVHPANPAEVVQLKS